jgi:hypothetical protein
MKKEELESMIKEELRLFLQEGFMDRARKTRLKVLRKRGLAPPATDAPSSHGVPGASEKDEETGKTYTELIKIWRATGNEIDYRGRPVSVSSDGKNKNVLSIGELSQLLRGAGKV